MKKIFFTIFLIFIFQSSCVYGVDIPEIPIETQESYEIKSILPVDKIIKGDIVYVDIGLDDLDEIFAFEIVVEYDKDFLEYKKLNKEDTEDSDIVIENDNKDELVIIYSKIGEQEVEKNKNICTIEFASLKTGETNVRIKSVKIVFSDMSFYRNSNLRENVLVNIRTNKPQSSGSGGGRPSGGGGGSKKTSSSELKVSGNDMTSSAIEVPAEPDVIISPETEKEREDIFRDVTDKHWAYEFICDLADKNIINGYEDNTFRPENSISRAEFAKIITSKESITQTQNNMFTDIKSDEWYYDIVNYAASIGIINGVGDGRFLPEENITRQEAAVIIMRFAEYKNQIFMPIRLNVNFDDEEDISDFAVGSIDALYTAGILSGFEDGKFYPQKNVTRAETSALVYNLFNKFAKEN